MPRRIILRHLLLHENNLDDDGVKALLAVAARGKLQKLTQLVLSLSGSAAEVYYAEDSTAEALAELLENGGLLSLERVSVNLKRHCRRLDAVCDDREIQLHTFIQGDAEE